MTVESGTSVHIPIVGLHSDERHFPDPTTFDPDRFAKGTDNNPSATRAYLGFGSGPRSCIGMRFALLEMKMALASLLSAYELVACEETPAEITWDPQSMIATPKEKLWIKLRKRH